MKRFFKLTLLASTLMIMCSVTGFAQKFGFVNTGDIIQSMPEMESVRERVTAYEADLQETLEALQVEFNTKYQDYQKNFETMSEAIRNTREKELQSLRERYDELLETAQQEMNQLQGQLMSPVLERVREAIEKVGRQNSLVGIFDLTAGALVYQDESQMTDVTPLVKAELGIN